MQKNKKGFTLAEVLITLGIIGVVAALTAPALIQHAASAKVGPAFSRCISNLSNGFQAYLYERESNTVFGADPTIANEPVKIFDELANNHVKMKHDANITSKAIKESVSGDDILAADKAEVFLLNDKSAIFVSSNKCKLGGTIAEDSNSGSSGGSGGSGDSGSENSQANADRCSFYFLPLGWLNKDIIVLGEDAFELAYDNKGNIQIYGLDYGDNWTEKCTDAMVKNFGPSSDRKSCGGRIAAMGFKKDY